MVFTPRQRGTVRVVGQGGQGGAAAPRGAIHVVKLGVAAAAGQGCAAGVGPAGGASPSGRDRENARLYKENERLQAELDKARKRDRRCRESSPRCREDLRQVFGRDHASSHRRLPRIEAHQQALLITGRGEQRPTVEQPEQRTGDALTALINS